MNSLWLFNFGQQFMMKRILPRRFGIIPILVLLFTVVSGSHGDTQKRADETWWSLQPLKKSIAVPPVTGAENGGWVRNEIDNFVLRRLTEQGLTPSPAAHPRALVRRLFVDLHGLPPTPEQVQAFENDPSDEAYEKLVDDLLSSPHYGERWARHWLDVVRYGESDGFERNKPRDNAYHYRDWVISALNRDLPYDEFVRKQIAGDLTHPGPEGSAAVGFLVAGVHNTVVGSSKEMKLLARQDELEEIIGAVGQTFLGLTINCARCHDHKYDPISIKEYYQLVAAIDGVRHGNREVLVEDHAEELAALEVRIADLEKSLSELDRGAREAILAKRESQPTPSIEKPLPKALAVWSFDKTFHSEDDAVQGAPSGSPRLDGGALVLDGKSFVKSAQISHDLREKTLVASVVLGSLDPTRGRGDFSGELRGI